MARSGKKGISYFSVDVDIFADRKLRRVRHAHGAGAMTVVLSLLCHIYGENGYYIGAGGDLYFDLADELGMEEAYVRGVIASCVEAGFFDAPMFEERGVLTSRRIQRNYMDATRKRVNAEIDRALCLAEAGTKAEETAFLAEHSSGNGVSGVYNPQSKVNQTKANERREEESMLRPPVPTGETGMALLSDCFRSVLEQDTHSSPASSHQFSRPSVSDVKAYCDERGNRVDAQRFVDFYDSKGWMVGSSPMRDWQATVRVWENNDARAAQADGGYVPDDQYRF